MRINKYVATSTGMSRRAADDVIVAGRVQVNGTDADSGQDVSEHDLVTLDRQTLELLDTKTILLNKPRGYITSRDGQGSLTVYSLIPPELHHLKPVGRLDKDTSGLLLMTNDGDLAQELTHPSRQKVKIYEARLDKPLAPLHRQMISEMGIQLEDGASKLGLERLSEGNEKGWRVIMQEGRNRQIRRTFESLGYQVEKLHRIQFGSYTLDAVTDSQWKHLN